MPQHEMRGAPAESIAFGAFARRGDEIRMRGEAEIVVAQNATYSAPVDHDMRALRALQHAAPAGESRFLQCRKLARELRRLVRHRLQAWR